MYKMYMHVLIGKSSTGESHTEFNDEELHRSITRTCALHPNREPAGRGNDRVQPSHLEHRKVEQNVGALVGDHVACERPVACPDECSVLIDPNASKHRAFTGEACPHSVNVLQEFGPSQNVSTTHELFKHAPPQGLHWTGMQ